MQQASKSAMIIILIVFAVAMLAAGSAASEQASGQVPGQNLQQASGEDPQYKQFSLEKVTCDTAVAYKATIDRFNIAVSAIAYGKGDEFRRWAVTDIRLNIGSTRVKADKSGKFYVEKDSLVRHPAAIVFAAMDAEIGVSALPLEKGIAGTDGAAGLGLLVSQTKGDIEGDSRVFSLPWEAVHKMYEGRDFIEITVENSGMRLKETIKIGIAEITATEARFNYSNMGQGTLLKIIDVLKSQIGTIEKIREKYKYGVDPEYAEMQKKIEGLEVERALAYKTWFEREQKETVDQRP